MQSALGRYELKQPLGKGGTGEVWEAVLRGRMGFRKPVALKWVKPSDVPNELEEATLLNEARMGARFSHPNVVATYEAGVADGRRFIAMELVRGSSVYDLARAGRVNPRMLVDIGLQAAAGLTHIHEQSVGSGQALVHRDIKPGNLLVDRGGVVKIADFGIARLARRQHGTVSIAGTPGYMAPEQTFGHDDPRSDLFALGATLFYLVTGRSPYGFGREALRQVQLIDAITAGEGFWDPIRTFLPGLEVVIGRCLRWEPAERYATARELARALRPLMPTAAMPGLAMLGRAREVTAQMVLDPPTHVPSVPSGEEALPLLGRADELEEVLDALAGGASVVALCGAPGSGKSRLALAALDARGGDTLVVPLAGAESEGAVIAALSGALGSRGDEAGVLASLKARGGGTLLLDGLGDLPSDRLLCAWSDGSEVAFLVTSRRRLDVPGHHALLLGGLPRDASLALFDLVAGEPVDPAHADTVAEGLDDLPGALVLAARRLEHVDIAVMAEGIEGARGIRNPDRTGRPGLWSPLESAWRRLDEAARQAWAQLSVFAGPATGEAVEAVVRVRGTSLDDALDDLVVRLLVDWDPVEDRYTCLRHHGAFLRSRVDDLQALRDRHLAWYAAHGDPATDVDDLVAAREHAVRRKDDALVRRLSGRLAPLVVERGPLSLAAEVLARAPDSPEVLRARDLLSARSSDLRKPPFPPDAPHRLLMLARHHLLSDRLADARSLLGRLGAPWADSVVEARLAGRAGALDRALEHAEQAVTLATASGDDHAQAEAWLARGRASRGLGELQAALRDLERASDLARLSGDRAVLFDAASEAVGAKLALGLEGVTAEAVRALVDARRYGAPWAVEQASLDLTEVWVAAGRVAEASTMVPDRPLTDQGFRAARWCWVRGLVRHAAGEPGAVALLQRAVALSDVLGNADPGILAVLARLHLDQGDPEAAEAAIARAVDVQDRVGNGFALVELHALAARAAHARGQAAQPHLARARHAAARAALPERSRAMVALAAALAACRSAGV
ncbi:MAG: serine/threonine protein kinase [Alphaproteobacteria bacterium]|nr:serine/threonine protein kinase [Alphaproteobacteria bacterium]